MQPVPLKAALLNTPEIELWPAGLLRARSNHDARALARARHVLRRKRDGRYLAADLREGLLPLLPNLRREPGLGEALDALEALPLHARHGIEHVGELPLHRLHERLEALGIDEAEYAARTGLELVAEPDWLAFAGFDRYRRPLWLRIEAAQAWLRLRGAVGDQRISAHVRKVRTPAARRIGRRHQIAATAAWVILCRSASPARARRRTPWPPTGMTRRAW